MIFFAVTICMCNANCVIICRLIFSHPCFPSIVFTLFTNTDFHSSSPFNQMHVFPIFKFNCFPFETTVKACPSSNGQCIMDPHFCHFTASRSASFAVLHQFTFFVHIMRLYLKAHDVKLFYVMKTHQRFQAAENHLHGLFSVRSAQNLLLPLLPDPKADH